MRNSKSILLAVASAFALVSTGGIETAHADGYVSLAIGGGPQLSGDLSGTRINPDGSSARLLVGQRFGAFGVEAGVTGYGIAYADRGNYNNYALSAAGRYNHPIFANLDLVGRLGLTKTWMNSDSSNDDLAGSGMLIGLGLEYQLNLGFAGGAVFVDYTHHAAKLSSDTRAIDSGVGLLMGGVSLKL